MTVPYTKPAPAYPQQLALLGSRGLMVTDRLVCGEDSSIFEKEDARLRGRRHAAALFHAGRDHAMKKDLPACPACNDTRIEPLQSFGVTSAGEGRLGSMRASG